MRNLDIVIVRFFPFVMFIQLVITIVKALNGEDDYPFNLLHSQSVFYALALFIISLSNKRYHCLWNRAMYVCLILIPLVNYLDSKFELISSVELYFYIIHSICFMTLITTAYLAIRHFLKVRKKKNE